MRAHLNWNRAYHEAIARETEQLRRWRRDPDCRMVVDLPGLQQRRAVRDLTDQQLEEVARRTAEYATNRTINRHGDERQLEQ